MSVVLYKSCVPKQDYSIYSHFITNLQAFEYIDSDGDGVISLEDLRSSSDRVRLGLSQSELAGLMEEADRDGDGFISKQEFISVMKKTNLFR